MDLNISYFKPDFFSRTHLIRKEIKIKNKIKILKVINYFFKDSLVNQIKSVKQIDNFGLNSNNYLFKIKKKFYVLKKYTDNKKNNLEFTAELMDWLNTKNIPIQKPIKNINKKYTLSKFGKKWRIVEYISGKTFSGTYQEFKNASRTIAKMSAILSKYPKKKRKEHNYFTKEDYKIINFISENLKNLEKYFSKKNSNLIRKHWQNVLYSWDHVKDFSFKHLAVHLIHNDLHPHNLITKHKKVKGILDWESCILNPTGISLAYAGLKICRQTLVKNKTFIPSKIGKEYQKIIFKYSLLNKSIINQFYKLALLEVLRRLCIIFKLSILKKDKKWNKVIKIQLEHLVETKELFS